MRFWPFGWRRSPAPPENVILVEYDLPADQNGGASSTTYNCLYCVSNRTFWIKRYQLGAGLCFTLRSYWHRLPEVDEPYTVASWSLLEEQGVELARLRFKIIQRDSIGGDAVEDFVRKELHRRCSEVAQVSEESALYEPLQTQIQGMVLHRARFRRHALDGAIFIREALVAEHGTTISLLEMSSAVSAGAVRTALDDNHVLNALKREFGEVCATAAIVSGAIISHANAQLLR